MFCSRSELSCVFLLLLQAELDKLKLLHASKLAEHQLEMKTRLEELATELDNKWTGTLR